MCICSFLFPTPAYGGPHRVSLPTGTGKTPTGIGAETYRKEGTGTGGSSVKELVFQLTCHLSMSREKQSFCLGEKCSAWNVGGKYCNLCQAGNTIAAVLREEL
jgi:hypothetical protein